MSLRRLGALSPAGPTSPGRSRRPSQRRFSSVVAFAAAMPLILGTTSLAVVATSTPAAAAIPSITLPVNPNVVLQKDFQGFGTSLAWWADVIGGWAEPQRSQLMDYLFTDSFTLNGQTVQGINLSSVRYNAGASEPGQSYPVVDPHLPSRNGAWIDSLIKPDGTYDWTLDANQRWVLAAAKNRGVSSFELFGNSAPWWMTYSGSPQGRYSYNSPEGCSHANLKPEFEDDYAAYLAVVAERFSTVGIDGPGSPKVSFDSVEPFNEPGNGWWCWGNNQEGMFVPSGQQSSVILNMRAALDARGLATGISATDSNNYWGVVSEFDALSSDAKAALAQINAHGYAGSDPEPIRDRAQANNLRFWQSEWGPADWGGYSITSDIDSALELATRVTNDLSYVRANAWQYWQAIEDSSRGSGPGYWGLIQAPLNGSANTYAIKKQFYTMGQYSKFIRPGSLIIDAGGGKSTAAFDPTSHKLVLVTYNDTAEALPVSYDLSRFTTSGAGAQVWRTSTTENLTRLPDITVSGSQVVATIPANSVVTHVISNVSYGAATTSAEVVNDSSGAFAYAGGWSDNQYSGGQQGAYGLWDQDEHSSQTTNATATFTFYGTRASLFGTLAPTSGKIGVSVDGAKETVVNAYATSRIDGAHLYTTPSLASGRHTVAMRILGKVGAIGGGTWGNVDRAVVETSGWINCASEGQMCAFSGPAEVRFGAAGVYVRSVHHGGTPCTTAALGASTVFTPRTCSYRPLPSAALVAGHSGKCLAVAAAGGASGSPVIQWQCTGGAEQKWVLTPSTLGFQLKPTHAPSMCLTVAGSSSSSGAALDQESCGAGPNQEWRFVYDQDGHYSLRPAQVTGQCLDVVGASHSDGAGVNQYDCNGYANQMWKLGLG